MARGQLNLFSFKPRVQFFRHTPLELNGQLWQLINETDPGRGYSFGNFNSGFFKEEWNDKKLSLNKRCSTVVIYRETPRFLDSIRGAQKTPIGFCTLSLEKGNDGTVIRTWIDVWVQPYYRDMGFGSLLVNIANAEGMKLTGKLPDGHDKNHTACWDARFRARIKSYDQTPLPFIHRSQLPLFTDAQNKEMLDANNRRMLMRLSRCTDIDYKLLDAFFYRERRV